MINSVRNAVLSILNKNNYGYVSPSDFNLWAKNAQMEVFDEYFSSYNMAINRENARMSGTGYADSAKGLEEMIEVFSVTDFLNNFNNNYYYLPSLTTTGTDYYLINKVLCYPTILASGANTTITLNSLEDSTADFISAGVSSGDIVSNTTTQAQAYVVSVVSATVLMLSSDIFTALPNNYYVFDKEYVNEAEKVNHSKITMLNSSLLTKPSNMFPAYTQEGDLMQVFPDTILQYGQVQAQYIRYPKEPKWTYVTLINGEPSFDQTQPDYQDFEVPLDDESLLISKILAYAGISIREADVFSYAKSEEAQSNQQQ
jgi:hypothetical protein